MFFLCIMFHFISIGSIFADELLSPFDLAAQEITQQPIIQPQQQTSLSHQKNDSHIFSYENCQKTIDSLALLCAALRVYMRYQRIYGPHIEMDWWEKTWNKVCPEIIQDANQHSKLFKETLEIVFETVTIKTVAKLVLFCWKGDASTMMKTGISKIKRFFRLLV